MQDTATLSNKKFLIKWVSQTAIVMFFGLFISFAVEFFITSFLESYLSPGLAAAIGYCFMGGGLGTLIGLIQWRLLHKKIAISATWILTAAGGLAISELVVGLALWIIGSNRDLDIDGEGILIYMLIYLVGGVIVGLLQQFVLEGNGFKANKWVSVCTLGWGLSFLIFLLGTQLDHFLKIFTAFFIGGLVFGIITGIPMLKIIDEKK